MKHLDCKKIIQNDYPYIREVAKSRIRYSSVSESFPTSCEDIKLRGYFPSKPQSKEEANFPLAFTFNVYHDYWKVEQYLNLLYAPQNQYCYGIDKKSPQHFKDKVRNLSKCFSNVYVVEKEYEMKSNGFNGNLYNLECMKILNKTNYKYLFLLQNDDAPMKTNRELVEILKIYNGSVDMNFGDPFTAAPINIRDDISLKFKDLNIFKEGDERLKNTSLMESNITLQKGYVESALPRDAVDYIINNLNITTLLNTLNSGLPYADEILWPTIMTSPELQVPGWQHYECSQNIKFSKYFFSRISVYYSFCPTNTHRHGLCLLGVESLSELKSFPHFFGNKFYSNFDAGGSFCWSEYMYNKKYFKEYSNIRVSLYQESPLIKYQRYKRIEKNLTRVCKLALL
uniref:Uncharacterized protein n=1 Tax=Parastrongyloides trichosuri TaxID=131310 RepID=A0A0N5A6C2_PARTI